MALEVHLSICQNLRVMHLRWGPRYNQWAIPPDYPVNYLSWKDLATYVEATLDSDKLNGGLCRIGVIKALAEMN